MLRASALLKDTRLDKDLSLEEISKKLKIPVKSLTAIENEDIKSFPQEPYCSLIIKDYADFLGLNGQNILCLFRRDFEQNKKNKNKSQRFFSFTPQFTFRISILIIIILFSLYLAFEYIKYNQAPKLKINWPLDTTITTTNIDISGTTDIESTVRINQDLIIVNSKGNFDKKIELTEGDNQIVVEAKSPSGKITTEEKTIKYFP